MTPLSLKPEKKRIDTNALNNIKAALSWFARADSAYGQFDLDLSAFLLNENNKVNRNEDFIFYGNIQSSCGSVIHSGDTAGQNDETITVRLSVLPQNVHKVLFAVTIHGGHDVGQVFGKTDEAAIAFIDTDKNEEIANFDLDDAQGDRCVLFGIVVKTANGWHWKMLGNGGQSSLKQLAQKYGVDVNAVMLTKAEPESPKFIFWCRHCESKLEAREKSIGRSNTCPKCKRQIIIERNSQPAVDVPPQADSPSVSPKHTVLPPPLPVKTGQKAGELLELTIKGMKWRFRWCPAGTFIMGSPPHEKGRRSNERQHQVTLTQGFWMQETATTQEQWESVMGSNPSQFKGSQFLPVECVSWDDCQEYIDKLNALFPSSYYRFLLPTEAQWEYACRAGSQTVYCCGDSREQLKDYAWYSGNSNYQTHLVGQKKANRWGLYDMHGNVWEWCSDQYGVHPTVSVTNPMNLMRGDSIRLPYYVFRGGDLYGNAENCRSASRDCYIPTVGYDTSGLRLSLVDKIK